MFLVCCCCCRCLCRRFPHYVLLVSSHSQNVSLHTPNTKATRRCRRPCRCRVGDLICCVVCQAFVYNHCFAILLWFHCAQLISIRSFHSHFFIAHLLARSVSLLPGLFSAIMPSLSRASSFSLYFFFYRCFTKLKFSICKCGRKTVCLYTLAQN